MSRVHTVLEYRYIDGAYVLVREDGFDYPDDAPVARCKGDDTAKQMELQQMQFNQSLMSIFSQQFGKQSGILNYLTQKMQPVIDAGGKGYSDEALTAMRTSATDQLSSSYQNAQKALQAQQFAHGSRDLPSGVNDQLTAGLMTAEASDKAAAQNNITLQNENLKQQNYWNAINALTGNAAMLNPQSYASEVTQGSNAIAGLSQAVTQSQQSGLMGALGGLTGGIFGAAGQAGGFGKLFCWVAAAVFEEDFETGAKTAMVRNWLWNVWRHEHWYAPPILWVYAKIGRWAAKQKILVRMLKPLFERALELALETEKA